MVENPFAPDPRPLSETRLCRGYFAALARELRLNENLLYIPCMPFPLPFFSPVHILINGSFLRVCNVRETKSQRRCHSRFMVLSLPSSPSPPPLPLFPPSFSSRTRVHCAHSNRDTRVFPRRSCFPRHSLLHPSRSMSSISLSSHPRVDIYLFRKYLTSYLLNVREFPSIH